RAAVELELSSSEDARTMIEELRFAAQITRSELRGEIRVAPLTHQQRQTIVSAARPSRWFNVRPTVWATGFAAAALALFLVTLSVRPILENRQVVQLAQPNPPAETDKVERQTLRDSSLIRREPEVADEKSAKAAGQPTPEAAQTMIAKSANKADDRTTQQT